MNEDANRYHLIRLHKMLARYLDEEELHDLCFYLGVDYADLPAQGRRHKARELVAYCERHGRIPELEEKLRQEHPDISGYGSYSELPENDRKTYLCHLRDALAPPGAADKGKSAETYEDLLIRFREQSVSLTSLSIANEAQYIRRFIDKEARYRGIPKLMDKLLRHVVQHRDPSRPVSRRRPEEEEYKFLLYGNPGCGKTRSCEHLAWEAANRALEDPDLPLPVLVDFRVFESAELEQLRSRYGTDTTTFLLEVVDRALRRGRGKRGERGKIPGEVVDSLRPYIRRYMIQGRILFIIDSINEVAPGLFKRLWEDVVRFADDTARQCGFVVAIRKYALLPGWEWVGKYIEICALDDKQVEGFARWYLDPTGDRPGLVKEFMQWLKPGGRSLPDIARTPYYLNVLVGQFRRRGPAEKSERTLSLPELMKSYVKDQLNDEKVGCPEDAVQRVDEMLQILAYAATREGAMGTRIREDALWRAAYPRGLPADYKEHLGYAEAARLTHSADGCIYFDHHLLQEYFAARAWLWFFPQHKDLQNRDLEEDFSDPRWEDTIRFAAALSEQPEQILEAIYGHATWKTLQAPGLAVSWPIRGTIADKDLNFSSQEKLYQCLQRESQRFYLALHCVADVHEDVIPGTEEDKVQEPAPGAYEVGIDQLLWASSPPEEKSQPIAHQLIDWAKEVLDRSLTPGNLTYEAMFTAQLLGEIPRAPAARALRIVFREILSGVQKKDRRASRAVQPEALRSLIRQANAGVREADEILGELRAEPGLMVRAHLQRFKGLRRIVEFLHLFLPGRKGRTDALATAASRELKWMIVGGVIVILVCLTCYYGAQAIPKSTQQSFSEVVDAILAAAGATALIVGILMGGIFAITVVPLFAISVVRGLRRSTAAFAKNLCETLGKITDVEWIRQRVREIWMAIRGSTAAKIVRRTWIAIVFSLLLSPFSVHVLFWALRISLIPLHGTTLAQAELLEDYLNITTPTPFLEWFPRMLDPVTMIIFAIPLFWLSFWTVELPRFGLSQPRSQWRLTGDRITLISALQGALYLLLFSTWPSLLFLGLVWRVRSGPYAWFTFALPEITRAFPTSFGVIILFVLQALIGVLLALLPLAPYVHMQWRLMEVGREKDFPQLKRWAGNESEWAVVRTSAIGKLGYMVPSLKSEEVQELVLLLLQLELRDRWLEVREAAAAARSRIGQFQRYRPNEDSGGSL